MIHGERKRESRLASLVGRSGGARRGSDGRRAAVCRSDMPWTGQLVASS